MRGPRGIRTACCAAALALALCAGLAPPAAASVPATGVDGGVIHLRPSAGEPGDEPAGPRIVEPRKGFDYGSFASRLEALWFQRKTFLASGRPEDADRQLEQIRSFCEEEGVRRLELVSGALLAEAERHRYEGRHERALHALRYAELFDPGRAQVHRARAALLWASGGSLTEAARELARAAAVAAGEAARDLRLPSQLAFVLLYTMLLAVLAFGAAMFVRHQASFRHEVEEWVATWAQERWTVPAGWAALCLPLLLWFAAGWTVVWWIVVLFRFMSRRERSLGVAALLITAALSPGYRVAVALYGAYADPAVRTTLASAKGEYDPDRIAKLRRLVEGHPDDPVYRFLLGGLYKNGRFFEEAYAEYKRALELEPSLEAAYINIGNIFYTTGQQAEAVRHYGMALELDPDSFLAHFNMHLAQSEAFRFRDAEASLERARELDASRVATLLAGDGGWSDRPMVQDATLHLTSLWDAALQGRTSSAPGHQGGSTPSLAGAFVGGRTAVALLALAAAVALLLLGRDLTPARRCIRCGRPHCQHCATSREGREYCSQCLHLFVLGDGLAPGIKSRKLWEIESWERRRRRVRSAGALLLPGWAQLHGGRPARGMALIAAWIAAWIAWQPRALTPFAVWLGDAPPIALLETPAVPALFGVHALALAALALPVLWLAGNLWRWTRRREA